MLQLYELLRVQGKVGKKSKRERNKDKDRREKMIKTEDKGSEEQGYTTRKF